MLSRIPCGGYDQPRIFVNTGQQHGNTKNRSYRFEPAAYSVSRSSSLDATPTHVSLQDRVSSPVLERSLERTACESRCLEAYWTCLLPHGQAFPSQAACYSTTKWTSAIQDLYHQDSLVRVVLLANALTLTAQRTKIPSLMVQGRRLYGLSLQMIARSLRDKNQRDWARILASSGLLAGYEVAFPCLRPLSLWFHSRSDLSPHSGANSYSSTTVGDIHGNQRPRG